MSYRYMRVIVMFDLPVTTSANLREYNQFRRYLIKSGFLMMQESVYCKLALNQTVSEAIIANLRKNKPPQGLVQVFSLTEKQFAKTEYITGTFQSEVLDSDQIQTIVIESPLMLSEYLGELSRQANGEEGRWILSEYEEAYLLPKACQIIINPFDLDFNQRKMITALYDKIEKQTISTECLLGWNELYSIMVNTLEDMIEKIDYNLSYNNEVEIKDFLKLMNLRFNDATESMIEKLIDYMCLLHEVLGILVFVFVNIKSYLNEEQINYLFQQAFYQKISILLFESVDREYKYQAEQVTIIDNDGCVISKNMG